MDQHPIPRQITTFEFKLIGFLTIKQFIYLVVFVGLGLAVYALTPIPILNYLFGILTGSVGLAFAFIPINDRPMEVWVRNLFKRLMSPTQYGFKKQNVPIRALQDLTSGTNSQQVATHVDSQKKLNSYLAGKSPQSTTNNRKQTINNLITNPLTFLINKKSVSNNPTSSQQTAVVNGPKNIKHPFITGVIKNHKLTPLGSILVYVKKDSNSSPLRIFKSNLHGIFLSYNSLPPGEYVFETKDPKQTYLFDTMKVKIEKENNQPLEIHSRELI